MRVRVKFRVRVMVRVRVRVGLRVRVRVRVRVWVWATLDRTVNLVPSHRIASAKHAIPRPGTLGH